MKSGLLGQPLKIDGDRAGPARQATLGAALLSRFAAQMGFAGGHVVKFVWGQRPDGAGCFDMDMARAARIRPIGVSWGYHTPDVLAPAPVAQDATALEAMIHEMLEI